VIEDEMSRQEIQDKIGLSDRKNFRTNYLNPALEFGVIEMTLPNKPNSKLQKYRLTLVGENLKMNAKTI
jgi:ATP-dependent DNA helicase RecG